MVYKTKGVCSSTIQFDVTEGKVHNIQFVGGCSGNAKGLASLAEGMEVADVIQRLEGLRCGFRKTSCPDQLAKALKETL